MVGNVPITYTALGVLIAAMTAAQKAKTAQVRIQSGNIEAVLGLDIADNETKTDTIVNIETHTLEART